MTEVLKSETKITESETKTTESETKLTESETKLTEFDGVLSKSDGLNDKNRERYYECVSGCIIIQLADLAGIDLSNIKVNNDLFCDRIFRDESLGLGESYMLGWWDVNNISLDELFYKICKSDLRDKLLKLSFYSKCKITFYWLYNYLFPAKTIEDSKVVALQHYDLGNDIYEIMLEPLVYSCAYFRTPLDTLRKAQFNKMKLIKLKLGIKPGMKVLDIGCGWGELASYLGEDNVYVDAITISTEQHKLAKNKFENDFVKFYLADYREFSPAYQYDAIVSVGMFEHVGKYNYVEFMNIVHKLLKPGGLFLLHTIGNTNSNSITDRWIGKYIFPNAHVPSLAQISAASEKIFIIEDVHNFGIHYDKTLICWHNNFVANFEEMNKKREIPLSQEFYRMWTYYLSICAALFRARKLQLYQVVLSKESNRLYQRPDF